MIKLEASQIQKNPAKYACICKSTWAPVIQHSALGDQTWNKLFSYFPQYQLFFLDGNGDWIGFANTIPIANHVPLKDLPDSGWDWLIEKGIQDFKNKIAANTLGGLQIGVNPIFRGQGYSKLILAEAKKLMKEKSLQKFILPIRPTQKHLHPELPMETYMEIEKDGKIYDPWIRTHLQAGAKIVKVCREAMRVEGSIADWESWTGNRFETSGKYPVGGALSLVEIDLTRNIGLYLEPNIWIYYD